MISSAQMVLLAIQAGVRLYAAGRKAYVEAALDRPLLLPLPTGPGITPASAVNFFLNDDKGRIIAAREESELIRTLLAAEGAGSLTQEGEDTLTQIYAACLRELSPGDFEGPLFPDDPKGGELVPIMTVRQWSKGELGDHPTALQRIAGTVVNMAVDYFAHSPEAISDRRPTGRALKAFLEAMDDLDFAEAPPAEIAGDLLLAVVDSVGAHPDLIGNSETEKKLVSNIAKTLGLSAKAHLDQNIPTEEQWQGSLWLQMIARAVIQGGTDTILADPCTVLGIGTAEGKLLQEVGGTIADLVIGPDKLRFQALFSGEGINTVVKAALKAAARNPEILRIDHQGLRNMIVGVAEGISEQPNLLTADIFPDLARLVLEKSADHLDLLWPDGSSDPARHLLVTAVRELFLALAEGTHEHGWPTLTRSQLMDIAEAVLNEIVENPDWMLKQADLGNATPLSVAIRAALDAFRLHKGLKLSAAAAAAVVSAAIRAAGLRLELLHRLPPGGADAGAVALAAAMDALFSSALGDALSPEKKWVRARSSGLVAVLEVALATLAKIGAEQKHIDLFRRELGGLIDERLSVEQLGERLEELLKAA